MKKILLFLLLTAVVVLSACGDKDNHSATENSVPDETTVVLETTADGGTVEQDAEGNKITRSSDGTVTAVEDHDGNPIEVSTYLSTHSWVENSGAGAAESGGNVISQDDPGNTDQSSSVASAASDNSGKTDNSGNAGKSAVSDKQSGSKTTGGSGQSDLSDDSDSSSKTDNSGKSDASGKKDHSDQSGSSDQSSSSVDSGSTSSDGSDDSGNNGGDHDSSVSQGEVQEEEIPVVYATIPGEDEIIDIDVF